MTLLFYLSKTSKESKRMRHIRAKIRHIVGARRWRARFSVVGMVLEVHL